MENTKNPSANIKFLAILGLVVITVLVFWNGLYGDFVWDDIFLISENPQIHRDNPADFFTEQFFPAQRWNRPGYYRPMVIFSYWADYQLFGMNPFAFHVTNLVLHILCVLLFFDVLVGHFKVFSFGAAWLASAIFALHPYHTESVMFISGRTDLLGTLFFLLALIHYIEFRESGRALPVYLAVGAFVLGLLSKELILIFVPVILIWEFFRDDRRSLQNVAVSVSPFVVTTLFYMPLRAIILGSAERTISATSIVSGLGSRLFYAPVIFSKYLLMLVLPARFNAFRYEEYHRHFAGSIRLGLGTVGGILAAIAFVALIIYLLVKGRRALAFWLSLIPIGLLLVLNIIPIPAAPISERFLYLPSLGFAGAVGLVVTRLSDRLKAINPRTSIFAFVAIVLLSYYSAMIYVRSFDWKNEFMLFTSLIIAEPESAVGHTGLAKQYGEMGEHDSVIYHAKAAIESDPTIFPAWLSLANAYVFLERFDEAEDALMNAAALSPNNVYVYNAYGNLESKRGNYEMAKRFYERAVAIAPNYYHANYNLARLAHKEKNYGEALRYLELARQSNPKNPELYRFKSIVLSEMGENERAREAWAEYLRLPGVKVGDFVGDDDAPGVIPKSMRKP
ncbi:MAG TPA: tetratricopeptide repeat protein [candidate division Zixibacteria bacterium]|nr:tetratricopeptide repeat protein [candidate division Zixibacteria bacterium]